MAWLFDTDALSEVLRRAPLSDYVAWLRTVPREDQYTSAVVIGELYHGAFRSPACDRHLENTERRVLPAVTVLPFDTDVAREYGRIRASLEADGEPLAEADLQIAATAVLHGLRLVTGNVRHFARVPGLEIERVLADAKSAASTR